MEWKTIYVIKNSNNVCKMLIFLIYFIQFKQPGVKLTPKNTYAYNMCTGHWKHIMFILCLPIKLGKVIKYEAKKMMSNIYLETLNIEWGQIDPKHNRRVNSVKQRESHRSREGWNGWTLDMKWRACVYSFYFLMQWFAAVFLRN